MATKKASAKPEGVDTKPVAKRPKKVSLDEYIDVQSCVVGKLVWVSKRTGYKVVWNEFGDITPLQVSDLLDMRNGCKSFFVKNWVALIGDRAKEILDYLQVSKYYKEVSVPEDLDEILLGDPDEVQIAVGDMSKSMKDAAVYRAKNLYEEGVLDSAKTVAAIRRATGVDISM